MPVIKRTVTAASSNLLSTLRFTNPASPAAVSLWASAAAAGNALSFGVDSELVMEAGVVNLEIADRVVDTNRDQMLFREPVPAGQYVLDLPTLTGADVTYLLVQELP